MNRKKKRASRTFGILTVLLMVSLAAESSVYAGAPSEWDSAAAVPASTGSASLPVLDTAALTAKTDGPREAKEVEAFLDAFFAREDIRQKAGAVAVSVVQGGKVLASKGYGLTDRTSKAKVEASRTTFRIASVSKVFTAAAVMQLVQAGKVSLQDNIEKYLDGYPLTNPFGIPVTIEDLLTHTSGFEVREPSDASYLMDDSQKPVSLKESILEQFPPVVREPGTSYMYDNFASRLLGYIVQQASGEPFGSYMQQHLFKPLGMHSSSFSRSKELAGRLASSYDSEGKPIPVYHFSPGEWPEGSMISTASDMALFMKAFLNNGRTADGTVVLSPESIKAMSAYHVAIHPDLPDMTYGFEAPALPSKTNGENVISKGGDILGFSSLLWLLPDRKTGVFITYNANQDLRDEFFAAFMDHYYSGHPTSFGTKGFKPQSREILAKFAGLYSDLRIKLLTRVEVSGTGTLSVSDLMGGRHELRQVEDTLFIDEQGKPLAFKADGAGRINDLKYSNLYSYAAKIPENPAGFPDVTEGHPYAKYILGLKSLGYLADDLSKPFQPGEAVTRGAFVQAFNAVWSIPESSNPPAFKDTANSPYRRAIQAAVESGLLEGAGEGLFEPDRPIRREEAAVIIFRLLAGSGMRKPDSTTKLVPGTSKWAEEAVSSAVVWKLHGPEVTESKGVFDYGSQRTLNKQELAALLFTMLLPD
ncbi:serine hydrolase [Paenibacillus graminis]|uniref:serine hydrolase n=1 Tax=Paenibacillus graminis TaxID=189425 RepID=UPI002DC0406C|nr:serine hydrolase [Paenibacillus graminis]MEC0167146.1 beta-lactamase family protein [Paenibacillus graminis]